MAPKKQKTSVGKKDEMRSNTSKHLEIEVKAIEPQVSQSAHPSEAPQSDSGQPTITTTETVPKKSGGRRSVCAMHKVIVKKVRGKKFKVTCNELGVPNGSNRPKLASYVGMLARTMIPIDIQSWPLVDPELKEKLWLDVQVFSSFCLFLLR